LYTDLANHLLFVLQSRDRNSRRILGRRDANVFIRAVKRHGLVSRMDAIAAEVRTGSTFE
jgi:hypothetical protein